MKNSIYKIKYLLFLSWDWEVWCFSVWGVIPSPPKETLLEIRGGNIFHCLGAPNNLIRPCLCVQSGFSYLCSIVVHIENSVRG